MKTVAPNLRYPGARAAADLLEKACAAIGTTYPELIDDDFGHGDRSRNSTAMRRMAWWLTMRSPHPPSHLALAAAYGRNHSTITSGLNAMAPHKAARNMRHFAVSAVLAAHDRALAGEPCTPPAREVVLDAYWALRYVHCDPSSAHRALMALFRRIDALSDADALDALRACDSPASLRARARLRTLLEACE